MKIQEGISIKSKDICFIYPTFCLAIILILDSILDKFQKAFNLKAYLYPDCN